MLTTDQLPVNTAPPLAVMMRVSEIAERDHVSAAAVSKSVKRLAEDHGLQVERDGRGRIVGVNVAHYDELRGKYADPSKVHRPTGDDSERHNYDEALAKKTAYDAERSRLQLEQLVGALVRRPDLEAAMDDASLRIGRTIDGLAGQVDELAAAYESGGIQGLRIKLRELVHAARDQVADVLEQAGQASGAV